MLDSSAAEAESLESALEEFGAVSVTYADRADQPLFEPAPGETPLWDRIKLSALFEADTDTERLLTDLGNRHPLPLGDVKIEILEDKDWVKAWMDQFQPIRCGESLWICPSWHQPPEPDAVNLMLDPGMAFGTGTHPTTWLCLNWLDRHPPRQHQVIDYGCGSGILAVASALLGAKGVWALDIDPQALDATRSNAEKNFIPEDRIDIALADHCKPPPAELVIANILAKPLRQLAPRLANLTKDEGNIVMSGILAPQADEVIEAYAPWFSFAPVIEKEGWVLLHGSKQKSKDDKLAGIDAPAS